MTLVIGAPTAIKQTPRRDYTLAEALSDLEFVRSLQLPGPLAWVGKA